MLETLANWGAAVLASSELPSAVQQRVYAEFLDLAGA